MDLAEAFIKNEIELETYYGLCAERVPEFKDQWLMLSAQERGHAGVFNKIKESIEENPSKWTMGKYLATAVNIMNEEIAQQISEIQQSSNGTADAIRDIVKTIIQVSEINASISGAVEQQSAATREVSANITGVTQAAAETGHGSGAVLNSASLLASQSSELEASVGRFLVNVRAM